MRVLVVVHGFPPLAQGGSEIYAHEHARMLGRMYADEVLVLTREHDPARPEFSVRTEERDGMSIAWINNTFRPARTFEETYRNDRVGAIAARLIDAFNPDVAHIHHLTCLSTTIVDELAIRQIPCFFTLHDYWLMCHRGQLLDTDYHVCDGPDPSACHRCVGTSAGVPRAAFEAASIVRAIEQRLPPALAGRVGRSARAIAARFFRAEEADQHALKRAEHMKGVCGKVTRFFAPSRYLRDRFVQFGIPAERITFSEYGFDHALFRPSAGAGWRERTPSARLRLGFLGSLMASKAPHLLLAAFADLPPGAASVDLVGQLCAYHGDDSYRQQLEPLLTLEGVRVHEPVGHDRIAAVFAGIDILVVPSIWPENSPLVIREAFLAGVPVVASRIGGIPQMVTDGRNGLLFEPGDVADLRRVLMRLLQEPTLLHTLRTGIPEVRTIEDDVRHTREAYQGALGSTGLPRREGGSREAAKAEAPASAKVDARVAAVVLNYRTPDDTLLAVRSLLASRRPIQDLIVVDNDPSDECRVALSAVSAGITYLKAARNFGFSGGMNIGVRHALARGADRVLVVNSDIIVPPDCLEHLEAGLARTRGAGIAGPLVLSRSDPGRVASFGMSFVPFTGRMRELAVGAAASSLGAASDTMVDGISGCLMLVNREVFETIGLLDEDYFFSFEDLDFCLRARRAGFTSVVLSAAAAYHEGSRSIGAHSAEQLYFAARNHLLLAGRADPGAGPLQTVFRLSSIVALNLAHAARSTCGPAPARFIAVARGTRDYFTGRFGDGSRPEAL